MRSTIGLAMVGILSLICSCKLVTNSNSSSNTVSVFRISAGDISGWSEDGTDGYTEYTAGNFSEVPGIDGAATVFQQNKMIDGIQQNLTGSNSKQLRAWVMDFGTDSLAKNMLTVEKIGDAGAQAIPGSVYLDTTAVIDDQTSLGASMVYAHFSRYYFQLSFTSYPDQKTEIDDAILFLEYYQNKESKLK